MIRSVLTLMKIKGEGPPAFIQCHVLESVGDGEKEGVDSDEEERGLGASSKDVGNPKEVSWLCPPLITIISRAGMRFKSHSWHAA